jgi:hypothetical protein
MRDQIEYDENLRSIPIGKNILHARREDPYGFWTMHFERGEVPDELKGTYTTFDHCLKRIQIYLKKKNPDGSA